MDSRLAFKLNATFSVEQITFLNLHLNIFSINKMAFILIFAQKSIKSMM